MPASKDNKQQGKPVLIPAFALLFCASSYLPADARDFLGCGILDGPFMQQNSQTFDPSLLNNPNFLQGGSGGGFQFSNGAGNAFGCSGSFGCQSGMFGNGGQFTGGGAPQPFTACGAAQQFTGCGAPTPFNNLNYGSTQQTSFNGCGGDGFGGFQPGSCSGGGQPTGCGGNGCVFRAPIGGPDGLNGDTNVILDPTNQGGGCSGGNGCGSNNSGNQNQGGSLPNYSNNAATGGGGPSGNPLTPEQYNPNGTPIRPSGTQTNNGGATINYMNNQTMIYGDTQQGTTPLQTIVPH